ncbi:MAG: ornithine cyclodeaminase family protein [Nitrososphaerales archaeon]
MKPLLYLSQKDVQECINMEKVIEAVEEGIKALGMGKAVQPEKIYLNIDKYNGFVKPMIAYIEPLGAIATKVFTHYPENPKRYNLPTVQAIIMLNDPETGTPLALMDGTLITALRTAATTALAAKYLARKDSKKLGIFGAGVQGKSHLLAFNQIFKLQEVRIYDIYKGSVENYIKEMGDKVKIPIIPVDSPYQCVNGADMVVTATTANEPLVKKDWLTPGMFLAKVGSFQELDPEIIIKSDKVVVDWWDYVSHRVRELIKLLNEGKINRESIYAELPEIVAAKKLGRQNDHEIILFISIGMGVEDAAVAWHVYNEALKMGVGTQLER